MRENSPHYLLKIDFTEGVLPNGRDFQEVYTMQPPYILDSSIVFFVEKQV